MKANAEWESVGSTNEDIYLIDPDKIRTASEYGGKSYLKVWVKKIIYNDITKYIENKKIFTDDEWNIREGFFRSCTCNPNFVLYRDFSKQYPNALEVSKQIRKARR